MPDDGREGTNRFLEIVVGGEVDAVTQAVANAATGDKLGGGKRGSHGVGGVDGGDDVDKVTLMVLRFNGSLLGSRSDLKIQQEKQDSGDEAGRI